MDLPNFDAYKPEKIALHVENNAVVKGTQDPLKTLMLAILAGAFIALGACLYTLVVHDSTLSFGLTRLIGGLSFSLGLILVVVAGAELFTGNNLLAMAWADGMISGLTLINNWLIVYLGNLVGALFIVVLVWASGHFEMHAGAVGEMAAKIAVGKSTLGTQNALMAGILCNILVCLAVWLSFAGRSVTDKIIAILFPITAFVALGFEHSVANMYFLPAGYLAGAQIEMADMLHNLLWVTLGNIIGGSGFVALVYWCVYLRPQKK